MAIGIAPSGADHVVAEERCSSAMVHDGNRLNLVPDAGAIRRPRRGEHNRLLAKRILAARRRRRTRCPKANRYCIGFEDKPIDYADHDFDVWSLDDKAWSSPMMHKPLCELPVTVTECPENGSKHTQLFIMDDPTESDGGGTSDYSDATEDGQFMFGISFENSSHDGQRSGA